MAIIWLIFLSLFFPFLWFYYFYRKDPEPEPKAWLCLAFFLGVLATLPSYFFQTLIVEIGITAEKFFTLNHLLSAFFEELFKFLFVWLIIFRKSVFDQPIDAIVYLAASAFGFAALENLLSYLSYLKEGLDFSPWFAGFIRFVGANFLHILASSMLAFGYAESIATRRLWPFTFSLLSATIIHFLYNILVLSGNFVVHVLPFLWAIFPIILLEIGHLKLHHDHFSRRRN